MRTAKDFLKCSVGCGTTITVEKDSTPEDWVSYHVCFEYVDQEMLICPACLKAIEKAQEKKLKKGGKLCK